MTETQRISLLARKRDENPILKIITNLNIKNEKEGEEIEDLRSENVHSTRVSTSIRSWEEMVNIA